MQNKRKAETEKIYANSVFGTEKKAYFDALGLDYRWVVSYSLSSFSPNHVGEMTGNYGIKPTLCAAKGGVYGGYTRESGSFDEVGSLGSNDEIYAYFVGFQCSGTVSNVNATFTYSDTAGPKVMYVAPLALTDYKKGDEIMLTVIYSEPINDIGGSKKLTLSSRLSTYFESPVYVDNGSGTNAIVFKVKAKQDISADTVQNVINQYLAFPESNYKNDGFGTNIGTLSITVKDILGNSN